MNSPLRAPARRRPVAPGWAPAALWRWLLSLGLVVALLQASIFALVDPDLSGWHPHHGHVTVGGYLAHHTHPWDHDHRAGPALVDPHHEDAHHHVHFTGTSDGLAGASIVVSAIAGGIEVLLAVVAPGRAASGEPTRSPVTHEPEVLTPPPRI